MFKWGIGVATAALATMAVSGEAQAQTGYLSAGTGWTFLDNADTRIKNGISTGNDINMTFETDDNINGRAAVGSDLGVLRVEVEVGMASMDVNSYDSRNPPNISRTADGTIGLYTAMANAFWDIDAGMGGLTPFLGVGIGAVQAELEMSGPRPTAPNGPVVSLIDNDQVNLGWQLMGGVSMPVFGNLELTAQYRFFDAGTMDTIDTLGRATGVEIKGSSLDVGIRMPF